MVTYAEVVAQTNTILGEYDFPLTLRQIYYRLVASGTLPNRRSAYNQLSRLLVKAREQNEVDDTRIEDRARQVLEAARGWDNPKDYIDAHKAWFLRLGSNYKRDLWAKQDSFLEVWVEKDALSRVIARAAAPFRVTTCPSRGYSSYTYIKRMAVEDRLADVDKPIVILDFRDHDPSGLQMTEDLQNRFSKYSSQEIEVKRVALTIDQVREYHLVPNPTKMADPRTHAYLTHYGNECWELDAIEPDELQRLVEAAIEEYVDSDTWEAGLEQEEAERQALVKRFKEAKVSV